MWVKTKSLNRNIQPKISSYRKYSYNMHMIYHLSSLNTTMWLFPSKRLKIKGEILLHRTAFSHKSYNRHECFQHKQKVRSNITLSHEQNLSKYVSLRRWTIIRNTLGSCFLPVHFHISIQSFLSAQKAKVKQQLVEKHFIVWRSTLNSILLNRIKPSKNS